MSSLWARVPGRGQCVTLMRMPLGEPGHTVEALVESGVSSLHFLSSSLGPLSYGNS
jgi:hypothetical protein